MVHFVAGVVAGEGGAVGSSGVETIHERLAAMVAGADRDAHLIEKGAEVVMMNALDVERE